MATANLSFSGSGATPNQKIGSYFSSIQATNPVSKALQTAGQPKAPAQLVAPTNQPVKSHVIGADGSVKQTYHTPATGSSTGMLSNPTAPKAPAKSTGVINQPTPAPLASAQNQGAPIVGNRVGIDQSIAQAGTPITPSSVPTIPNPDGSYNPQGATQPAGYTAPTDPTKIQGLGTPIADTSTYSGLIKQAAEAQAAARNFNQNLENAHIQATQTGSDLPFQTGVQQALQRTYGSQATALSEAAKNATELARVSAPVQVPYSNQFVDPRTGQPVGGGATNGSLQDAVKNVVSKLTAGQMSYSDAVSALSGYGQGGINALQQSLPQGFNIAQSNVLAGQQGSIGVNYQLAEAALKNVESLVGELNPSQRTNIPGVNALTQGFSTLTGIGSEQTRAVTGAVQSLRNAYASLLASSKGGTPTDYSGQALAEIPDQPTPNDLKAIRHNFEVLGKARADILGNPGQAGQTTPSSSTGLFNW